MKSYMHPANRLILAYDGPIFDRWLRFHAIRIP